MDDALYSARIGRCKPDPAAYEHALAAAGIADPEKGKPRRIEIAG